MSAEDPYRWAKSLQKEGLSREQVRDRLVAGGVEVSLATEILDSIERNRPRMQPLRMVFGLAVMAGGVVVGLVFKNAIITGGLLMLGAFSVFDGFRGKR